MDYELEKTVQFKEAGLQKGLYDWCLNEIEEASNKKSEDLIPWPWSLFFTISSLRLIRTFEKSKKHDENEEKINEITSIVGSFHSGICTDGKKIDKVVDFSMFGTGRSIEDFQINISLSDTGVEGCSIWGCPSYKYEVDFKSGVTDDCIVVNVHLNEKKFNQLVQLVESKEIEFATIMLGEVSGFYACWSPSISTSRVKVLTDVHNVEGIGNSRVDIFRLGKVGCFQINLNSFGKLNAKPNLISSNFYSQFSEIEEEDYGYHFRNKLFRWDELQKEVGLQEVDSSDSKKWKLYIKMIDSLRLPLWLVVILLFILLVK